jgi:hypothetical protein
MTTVIPASADTIIISIEYAPNGLDWARLYDNLCLGWTVSEVVPTAQKPGTPTAALSGHHRHLAGRGAGHCASLAAMGEIHWSSRSGGYDSQLRRGSIVDFFDRLSGTMARSPLECPR